VTVKLRTGYSEQQKQQLAEQIAQAVTSTLHCGDELVSIALEEVSPDDWKQQVYQTDILNPPGTLYKKPGYTL
jgi:4-oxalocrotonate tautomerase